jgi:hypothetical protein
MGKSGRFRGAEGGEELKMGRSWRGVGDVKEMKMKSSWRWRGVGVEK